MFSNVTLNFLKFDKVLPRLVFQSSALSRISLNLDKDIQEQIENNELKARHHPGILKAQCNCLPKNIKKAITSMVKSSRKQLMQESDFFRKYLFSRQLPPERDIVNSKLSSIKREVQDKWNVDVDELSEQQRKSYERLVENNAGYILKQRVYNWQPIEYSRYMGLQYLCSRASVEYVVLMKIFNEIKVRGNPTPKNIFDFGSGVGTVVWAANDTWGETLTEIFCVDTSREMNSLSEELVNLLDEESTLRKKIFYRQFLPTSQPYYDIVVSAYSLLELSSSQIRRETLEKLWKKTTKYLVLVEQGTSNGFKLINEARDFIFQISKNKGKNHETPHVFSPCPHELTCPRISQEKEICNFEILYFDFPKMQTKKELYSYIVIAKEPRKTTDPQWPRIVKPVLRKSRHAICRLCTKSGSLEEIIFSPAKSGRIQYKCAKSSKWGDRLPINMNDPAENSDS